MLAVIQRVFKAAVFVDGETVGSVNQGLLVLLGVRNGDTQQDAELLAKKIAKLRIFTDENDKMNLSVTDICGGALVVSNFTLCANYRHGNRPDYIQAAPPEEANALYEYFKDTLSSFIQGPVESGRFGAHMTIDMCANGPVTIVMDSEVLKKTGK